MMGPMMSMRGPMIRNRIPGGPFFIQDLRIQKYTVQGFLLIHVRLIDKNLILIFY